MVIPGYPDQSEMLEIFRAHYEQYYPKVLKHLYFLMGNNDFNEDVAHDVFMKYWDAPPGSVEYPGAWLCKVAANLALNQIRSRKRGAIREENLMAEPQEIFTTEDDLIRTEDVRQVREVLSQLPEDQRACLLLKFSGYSYDEISQATGVPRGNVGQMIARGKAKFTTLYQKAGGQDVL